jgi:hypothetical protein
MTGRPPDLAQPQRTGWQFRVRRTESLRDRGHATPGSDIGDRARPRDNSDGGRVSLRRRVARHPLRLPLRSAQRHFVRATGITHRKLRQIERARFATLLLHSRAYFESTADSHVVSRLRCPAPLGRSVPAGSALTRADADSHAAQKRVNVLSDIVLWLFVVFSGISVGAGFYELRVNVPRWFPPARTVCKVRER